MQLLPRASIVPDQQSQAATASAVVVQLGRRGFALTWVAVLFFHLISGFVAAGFAVIYLFLSTPDMAFYVSLLQLLPSFNYMWIVALYATISGANLLQALWMVGCSLASRQFVFDRPSQSPWWAASSRWRLVRAFNYARFVVGVRGPLFDAALLVQELAEVVSQTYQAHTASRLLSKPWANQVFGALIFFNCTSSFVIHALIPHNTGRRRLLSISLDLCLDFVWGFVFPAVIVSPYLAILDGDKLKTAIQYLTSDTVFVQAVLESRQVCIVSWADAVATTLPYLSIYNSLDNIKLLLRPPEAKSKSALGQHSSKTITVTPIEPILASPSAVVHHELHPPSVLITASRGPTTLRHRRRRLHVLMLIPAFGAAVFATSLASSSWFISQQTCPPGCKLRLYPWFISRCVCSVIELNCYERGITGLEQELADEFLTFHAPSVSSLIIAHCPALSMPSELHLFTNLLFLEFYNVSIVQWTRDAAVSQSYLPHVRQLYFARCIIGDLPEGLTYDTTPSLVDIDFTVCKLAELPADLDRKWPHVLMLYVEFCGLTRFPIATTRMGLTDLSLVGNNIWVLPNEFPEVRSWMFVYLDRNPIAGLPERIGGFPNLQSLSFQQTNISGFPPWISELHAANRDFRVTAYATPACHQMLLGSSLPSEAQFISCSLPDEYILRGMFPVQIKDHTRRTAPDSALPIYPVFE